MEITSTRAPEEQPALPGPELRILVVDDEPEVLQALGNFLEARGHRVRPVSGGGEGLALLAAEEFDVVITDMRMPDVDGFAVLAEVRRSAPHTEVVVMTGHGDIDSAVRAMKEGAFDFFAKPVRLRELMAALQRITRHRALFQEKEHYRERLDQIRLAEQRHHGLAALIGESPGMHSVKELIRRVCATDTTVLIRGETGTGKEVVARAIYNGSGRCQGPFVSVDCTAIPESLVESQLYGHVKGAFTDAKEARKGFFEQADGGVLFLDEIGDMSVSLQAKLLRALEQRCIRRVGAAQETPVDVRVISATNRDLGEGEFRRDLYYRLNTITIHLPPLRERGDDVALLAEHFLQRYVRELHKPVTGFTLEALALLAAHPFPGNVRELRNVVERAVLLSTTSRIGPADLQLEPLRRPAGDQTPPPSPPMFSRPDPAGTTPSGAAGELDLATLEHEAIRTALERTGGNRVQAAKLLGISRTALQRRLRH